MVLFVNCCLFYIKFYILFSALNTLENWYNIPDYFGSIGTPFLISVHVFYYFL